MTSPTQRTLALCRKQGFTVQVVERWCSFTRRRHDLFGIIDVLAINDEFTIGIQSTSGPNVSARIAKAMDSEELRKWLESEGRKFFVHGWRKLARSRRWECREIELRFASDGNLEVSE